jgi:hypothetical protein
VDIISVFICSRCEALALSRNPKAVHMGATSHSGYPMKVEKYKSGYTKGYRIALILKNSPKSIMLDYVGDIECARLMVYEMLYHVVKKKDAMAVYMGEYRTFCETFENMESVEFFDVSSSEVSDMILKYEQVKQDYESRQTE